MAATTMMARKVGVIQTLLSTTTTATGAPFDCMYASSSYTASVVGTGAVTATVIIEASNDGTYYVTIGTITLSGTTSAADGFVAVGPWQYVRARSTAISGTGAAITATGVHI